MRWGVCRRICSRGVWRAVRGFESWVLHEGGGLEAISLPPKPHARERPSAVAECVSASGFKAPRRQRVEKVLTAVENSAAGVKARRRRKKKPSAGAGDRVQGAEPPGLPLFGDQDTQQFKKC